MSNVFSLVVVCSTVGIVDGKSKVDMTVFKVKIPFHAT